MAEIGIILLIALVCAWGIRCIWRRMRRGGGCCGEHAEAEKKRAVKDRKKSHYPYRVELKIEGMTCENCARRVQNALNTLEGTWAKVDIGSHRAVVLLKDEPDEKKLSQTVMEAGYFVSGLRNLGKNT